MAEDFYENVLRRLIHSGELRPAEDRVLVVAGGTRDRDALIACGFEHATISNLDSRMTGTEFAPFDWKFFDAEIIGAETESYDIVLIHNGLHHCHVPQQAIREMLRVTRRGVLLYEPYDNLVTRLGVALGVGQEYETAAVYYNDCAYGGVANTPVANFIYRFSRHEIRKTVACAHPYGPAGHKFFHALRMPWGQLRGRKNKLFLGLALLAYPFLKLLELAVPTQMNCFAAWIEKPNEKRGWWPWVERSSDGTWLANRPWLEKTYNPKASR